MPSADKLDGLQIGHVHVIIFSFCGMKSFIFSAKELYYHATIMVSRKQHLKRISAQGTDGKRVAKRARQSRQASPSPSNLDNSDGDHNNLINIIESRPQELVFYAKCYAIIQLCN